MVDLSQVSTFELSEKLGVPASNQEVEDAVKKQKRVKKLLNAILRILGKVEVRIVPTLQQGKVKYKIIVSFEG